MSSKVALIMSLRSKPNSRLCDDLSKLGYTIIEDPETRQNFSLAIVCLSNQITPSEFSEVRKRYQEIATVFFTAEDELNPVINQLIDSKASISNNYTIKELELAIELAKLEAKNRLIEPFLVQNINTDHARLRNLLSEEIAWTLIFEQLPNGILLTDSKGSIVFANHASSLILGYSHVELLSLSLQKLTSTSELQKIDQNIKDVMAGNNLTTETYSIKKDGSLCYALLHLSRVSFPDGTQGILTILNDLTSTTHPNENVLDSIGKYRIIIEQANIGIVYIKRGIILYANPYIKKLTEYNIDDVVGSSFCDFIHVNDRNLLLNRFYNRTENPENPEPSTYETTLIKANGNAFPVEVNASLFRLQNEVITIAFIKDISHAKENERIIKESEESFRDIFNNASYAIYILDISGVILDANLEGLNLTKLKKPEVIGMSIDEISTSETNNPDELNRKIRLAFQNKTQTFEYTFLNKNGDQIPVDITLSKGKYFGLDIVIAMVHDISKRKDAENSIIESEKKYRSLTEQLSLGLFRVLTDGEIVYSNTSFAQMLGLNSSKDLIGCNISDFIPFDFLGKILLNTNYSNKYTFETVARHTNTSSIWVSIIVQPINSVQNCLLYFDCIIDNISKIKEVNDTLRESESRINAMLNALPDQLYKVDHTGILFDYKSSNKENFPKLDDTLIGKSISNIFPTECFNKIIDTISKCRDTNKMHEIECSNSRDGQTLYYEMRIAPIVDDYFLILQRDTTRRKETEEKMQMLAQAVETANDSISITTPDGKIKYVNPAFCKTYGFSIDEVIGKDVSIMRTPDFNPLTSKNIDSDTLTKGWEGEIINIRRDGSVFPVFLSTSTIFDEFGKPKVMVGIARNISEQKRVERELVRTKESAEESNRLKTAFLSNLSHEIRSPMNAVLGFVQLIKSEESLSVSGIQNINQIYDSGKQLLDLIEDIIDVSKIQTNQINLNISPFNLNLLFFDLFNYFCEQIKKKELDVVLQGPQIANEADFIINSDYTRIRQILTNLLTNAIKFTPSGNVWFGYTLIVDDYSSKFQCFVKDTGIGIASEKQTLIFDLFRQGEDSYTRSYGGSGLGLTIAKGLVETLGGNIWVESEVNQGTTFFFTIPYSNKNNNHDEKSTPAILLVEKSENIKFYYDELIPLVDARMLLATNADEARKLFVHDGNVKVAIIDTSILDEDNYKIINDFKQANPSVKIIAQTKIALEDELSMSTISGCDDYIVKSRNINNLIDRIKKYIAH